jgi:hypothetical protein
MLHHVSVPAAKLHLRWQALVMQLNAEVSMSQLCGRCCGQCTSPVGNHQGQVVIKALQQLLQVMGKYHGVLQQQVSSIG